MFNKLGVYSNIDLWLKKWEELEQYLSVMMEPIEWFQPERFPSEVLGEICIVLIA